MEPSYFSNNPVVRPTAQQSKRKGKQAKRKGKESKQKGKESKRKGKQAKRKGKENGHAVSELTNKLQSNLTNELHFKEHLTFHIDFLLLTIQRQLKSQFLLIMSFSTLLSILCPMHNPKKSTLTASIRIAPGLCFPSPPDAAECPRE